MGVTHEDFEYIEHRIYHDYVASADFDLEDPNHAEGEQKRNWTPYEQDLSQYPEIFHKYQENYAKYDKLKEEVEMRTLSRSRVMRFSRGRLLETCRLGRRST